MGCRVAVVGATGAVGKEMLEVLKSRKFPISDLQLFASARSEGKEIHFNDRSYRCQVLKPGCFSKSQIAFFDASDEISRDWAHQAAESGAWVVDNSATYRMDESTPLLVPEVNGELLQARLKNPKPAPKDRIFAGPNCTTVQLVVALKPLRDQWGLKRVVVSTYQSVSGAGAAAIEELRKQTGEVLAGRSPRASVLAHPIAFNSIPQIGGFREDGYTSEEHKIIAETRKILGLPNLRITATAVRIPTLSCHGESVNVECERPFKLDDVRKALSDQEGLIVQDEPAKKVYPMAIEAVGRDSVYVGRLRQDLSTENGLNFWIVSDNLRKGAALNAIQIGEMITKHAVV